MPDYTDLEIGLHRRDADHYSVELRFSQPDSDDDKRRSGSAQFDLAALQALALDPTAYGQALARMLFADPAVLTGFTDAHSSTQTLNLPLRLRLLIGPSAPELHRLRWETLRDPRDESPLCTNENLLFSRYLSSLDWRPVRPRPKGDLRALVVIANPANSAKYQLAPVDVIGELNRATKSLGDIPVTAIGSGDERATLNNLIAHLRDGPDILYLACHGTLKDEPWLWLEDDAGQAARVAGSELVTRLRELKWPPTLVVLASCQSAGNGAEAHSQDEGVLSALGPRLAEAGVPAVIAMQGNVTMETVAQFMPAFFRELQQDGQIDRAGVIARGVVRARSDYWMPVLFMRLKSGRLWYVPGFGEEQPDFEKWQSLTGFVREATCTPIIGPGLLEPLLGSAREIAQGWAEKHNYPMAPQDRDELPRVAQYVGTRHDPAYLRLALRESLRDEMLRRHRDDLPDELIKAATWGPDKLLKAIEAVGVKRWEHEPSEPHKILAQLRLPIYITANPDNLLARALAEAGAEPQVRICRWNDAIPLAKSKYEDEPTPERPLVYHLFGHLSEPYSIVLTEDEYFDYLIGVTNNKDQIPEVVRAALTSTALLFLGFQMDDWNFRVLFRNLLAQGGSAQRKFYSHVAAQIEPEEGRILDPKRARRYLEKYFESEKIGLYWGSTEEFLKALWQHLQEAVAA